MTKGTIGLSHREFDRLQTILSVINRQTTQLEAATRLGLGCRQVKRLVRRVREDGATGVVSRHRNKRPNNSIAEAVRSEALRLIGELYADFSPTFAHQKLTEEHALRFSVETLRQWMIEAGIWRTHARRTARIHQHRQRRARVGELVQIDGSPHDWFEGRAPYCTLIVFIDDATSRLMALRFAPAETTYAYMETLRGYLAQHARPVAFYSDKHSIFRVNQPDCDGELTQFTRALKTLEIEPIHANTPQAKGRVERANQTLQDRLVKELRLRGISTLEEANCFLPQFIKDHNRRFARPPRDPENAHRPVRHNSTEIDLILCLHSTRRLSKNLTCQYNNVQFQIQHKGAGYRLRQATITVCEAFDGRITLLHQGKTLPYRTLAHGEPPIPLADDKSIAETVNKAITKQKLRPRRKPAPDHPWNRQVRIAALRAAAQ